MKGNHKVALFLIILLIIIFLIYFNKDKTEEELNQQEDSSQGVLEPTRYFSPGSDKIMIEVGTQNLYTDTPATTLTYYALDSSNNPVYFRESDRAFVRILGITSLFTNNTEIFHPESNGSKDYTLFLDKISISEPGTYLVKVCLGRSINLNSEGTLVWPFGCFEDQTSVQMNIYTRRN
ncbi:MAG TPA: hypothetical protein VMV95_00875 [Bacillota bacterium]|nr:hypothetical protein [Bacillota bacterium]